MNSKVGRGELSVETSSSHLVCCALVAVCDLCCVQPVTQQHLRIAQQLTSKRQHLL